METEQRDQESNSEMNVKLAQLYRIISKGHSEKHFERIIDRGIDVNVRIPDDFFEKMKRPEIVGSTLLHCAVRNNNYKVFNHLMDKEAEYTVKNGEGSTALHEAFNKISRYLDGRTDEQKVENSFIDSILKAHVKDGNFDNPCDKHGISHFHIACLMGNLEAVKLFVQHNVSVNHAVNEDSPVFPGYTAIHFATEFGNTETIQLLLSYDTICKTIKNANGETLLHLLVRKQLKLIHHRNTMYAGDGDGYKKKLEENEKVLKFFLNSDDDIIVNDIGLSTFHAASTMLDTSLVKSLLTKVSDIEHCVNKESSVWPGYTALHFAALCNIETVKLLLKHGADPEARDAKFVTPFSLFVERYNLSDIIDLISSRQDWSEIKFLDTEVKLTDFINALHNASKSINTVPSFSISGDSSLPLDSPLFPGCTPLHLAVFLFERKHARFHTKRDREDNPEAADDTRMMELMFDREHFTEGANPLAQDAYGRTSIHYAFRQQKYDILRQLQNQNERLANPMDIDNFSHLHIACLQQNDHLVEELLFIGEDANMPLLCDIDATYSRFDNIVSAGSTPLHIAILIENYDMMKKLLSAGADPFAQDVHGITPIHRSLQMHRTRYCDIFLSSSGLSNVTITGGITYLHIASIANDTEAVKKLIIMGADVNAAINFDLPMDSYSKKLVKLLEPYVGSTPLHFALENDCHDNVEILLLRGADIFAKKPNGQPIIHDILRNHSVIYVNILLVLMRNSETMRTSIKNKTGLTLLHIACNAVDISSVKYLIKNGGDVNAQALPDSPVWPGCTPLHVLLITLSDRIKKYTRSRNSHIDDIYVIMKLLIKNGADVTLSNADGETANDLSRDFYRNYIRDKAWLCTMLPLKNNDYYDLNFTDSSGVSCFHEACYQNNIPVIKEFLKRGIDVNQRVHVFSEKFAGYTPLHFTAKQCCNSLIGSSRQLMTLEILLDHKADVNARNAEDDTPLHIIVEKSSSREKLIEMLIKFGADLKAHNIYGKTPFEVLLSSYTVTSEEIAVFLQNGVHINSYSSINEKGYIPLLYDSYDIRLPKIITTIIENTPDITEADDKGRTIIHNLVSSSNAVLAQDSLTSLCLRFIEYGCDIDQQDKSGKTALHTAVQWNNSEGVSALLALNADAGIVDNSGKTAAEYAFDTSIFNEESNEKSYHMRFEFSLQSLKFEVTKFQEFIRFKDFVMKNSDNDDRLLSLRENLENAKEIDIIPKELTLYDFASETGAISNYMHMPIFKRNIIDEFFKSMDNESCGEVSYWLKNHYRKALARCELIEPAKSSLISLLGFPLPHLCCENVFVFLTNVDLKNLIAADTVDADET